jgi:hypothetical protein
MNIRVRHARLGKLDQCARCKQPTRVYKVDGEKAWLENGERVDARWCEACIAATSTASDPFCVIDQATTEATK